MYRLDRDSARPPRREFVIKAWRITVAGIAAFALAALWLMVGGWPLAQHRLEVFAGLMIALFVAYGLFVIVLNVRMARQRRILRQQEIAKGFDLPALEPLFEYRSRFNLLGWPVVHIRLRGGLERGPVKAWIAVGDSAIGLIFALGAVAIAPFSFGGMSVGLVTLGGFALGLASFGALSLGPWACGGFAAGWHAFGACAVGWRAAQGFVAVARDFAVGAVALARHANDAAAQAFIQDKTFFQFALAAESHGEWLSILCLLPPALWLWWRHKDSGAT
jgi:hypothetical protein